MSNECFYRRNFSDLFTFFLRKINFFLFTEILRRTFKCKWQSMKSQNIKFWQKQTNKNPNAKYLVLSHGVIIRLFSLILLVFVFVFLFLYLFVFHSFGVNTIEDRSLNDSAQITTDHNKEKSN